VDDVQDYFAGIGYKCPEFIDVADFLQIISSGDGEPLYDPPPELRKRRPLSPTVSELANIFRNSSFARAIIAELRSPLKYAWEAGQQGATENTVVARVATMQAVKTKYAGSFLRLSRLIVKRFVVLWIRDRGSG
jgi:hypothetical protein